MKTIPFFCFLSISVFASFVATAQSELSTDETTIHQIVQNMQDGWNNKSGEQFAAHFSNDHSYVVWNGMYMPHVDRSSNAQVHQSLFDGPYRSSFIIIKVDNLRFIHPDVAMVHTLINSREGDSAAPLYPELVATILMVKNGNEWEIVSFHNLNIEYDQLLRKPEPTDEEKLALAKENYPGWYR
ncbi:MAG TPA: SgcJ/EcaC family oxidoreductase [Saprospiraceae bacterium]|nr:SgcJ/EcaC family oxidoreductase [Saprospiraceae bacterium]